MRPVINQQIATYVPDFDLNMVQAQKICSLLISSSSTIKSLSLKAIFFSFEAVERFEESAVVTVAKTLLAMQNKVGVVVAFINYNDEQFNQLKALFPNKGMPLFRNATMAMLLLGLRTPSPGQVVIYYDTDSMMQVLIAQELTEKGMEVISVSSESDFLRRKNEYGSKAIYIYDIAFDIAGNFIPIRIKDGIVYYTLPAKVTKTLNLSFNMNAHMSRLTEGFKVFVFDATGVSEFRLPMVDFFVSLSLNSVKFDAIICIYGLNRELLDSDSKENLKKSGVLIFNSEIDCLQNQKVRELSRAYQSKESSHKGLTKKLVAQLPVFVNASIETITSLTGGKAQKTDYKVTTYHPTGSPNVMGSFIEFEGDITGQLILSLSKEIVQEASTMILGEETTDEAELLDVISEFANIIAGRTKALLSERGVTIGISLPQPCKNEEQIIQRVGNKQGIQVDLLLNGKPLILFLTH